MIALILKLESCVKVGEMGYLTLRYTDLYIHSLIASSTEIGNCEDGAIRLVGGANITLGRVEVCMNNAWGAVCNNLFGTREAKVICGQLGFDSSSNSRCSFAMSCYSCMVLSLHL